MKNNKFVSLSDFKNTLVINGFNGEMIEKAEHKVHKYLRKEGGKYIYDYDKMNVKEHEDASWEHHVQHIVNDTKAEGRKMAKDKELEEHYRKHAKYHKEEKEKHTKLAEEKTDEMISKFHKLDDDEYKKLGFKKNIAFKDLSDEEKEKLANTKIKAKHYEANKHIHKTFEQQVDEHLESMKGKGVTEVHDSVMKKFKLNAKDASNQISRYLGNRNILKKSEAFDALIPTDIDEKLEKAEKYSKWGAAEHTSRADWHKDKAAAYSEGSKPYKMHK